MSDTVRVSSRALLERIVDFPLIAMLVAILLYAAATALSLFLGKFVSIGQPGTAFLHMVITLTIVLTTYKLAIARVGQHPRDDLPAKKAIINFGWGFATGAIIFSAIVGIAAVLGVYRVTGAGSPADIVLPVISASIMPGFMEELLFRGILFRWIEEFREAGPRCSLHRPCSDWPISSIPVRPGFRLSRSRWRRDFSLAGPIC
jgi:uncharacterized protein